jgi:cell wall-associated NlpC family hydrolase
MKQFVDWPLLKEKLLSQLGKPYVFGTEVRMDDTNPLKFDCSELVEWSFRQIGIKVPDGSYNQFEQSVPILTRVQFGDLVFLKRPNGGSVYHVGIVFNAISVFEARGNPYNKVMMMPIKDWVAHPNFAGARRLKAVMDEAI